MARQPDRALRTGDPATDIALEAKRTDAPKLPAFASKGVLLSDVSFAAATQLDLSHGLGRALEGFTLLRKRVAAGDAWEVTSDTQTLSLFPNATFTADVWVW